MTGHFFHYSPRSGLGPSSYKHPMLNNHALSHGDWRRCSSPDLQIQAPRRARWGCRLLWQTRMTKQVDGMSHGEDISSIFILSCSPACSAFSILSCKLQAISISLYKLPQNLKGHHVELFDHFDALGHGPHDLGSTSYQRGCGRCNATTVCFLPHRQSHYGPWWQ